jgi:hypothetical protein
MTRRSRARGWSGRRLLLTVLAVLVALGSAACVGPTVTDAGYRNKVADTAKAVSSAIASARLGVQLDLAGRMAFALTDQTVSDAESDAESAASALASRQPPTDGALRLYRQANGPIQDAVDALRTLRIAVRRGEPGAIRSGLDGLDGPARRVDEVQKAAQAG